MIDSGIVSAAGGGFPPGGGPPGGGWGPPPGAPPGGGGYGPPGGPPGGGGYPPGGGGYPPGGAPPGGGYPPGGAPPGGGYPPGGGAPPGGGGYGPPGGPPGGGGYGPPGGGGYGGPPGGAPPGGGGYGAPPGAPPGGYGPPGAPPGPYGGGFAPPPGHMPPGAAGATAPAGSWAATEAIGFGWNSLTKNFVGLGLGFFVVFLVVGLPIGAVIGVLTFSANLLLEFLDADFLPTFMMIAYAGIGLYAMLAGAFMGGGVVDAMLRTARGQIVSIGDFFKGGRFFGAFLVASILSSILFMIGYVLCIVPGYILLLGLSQTAFLIVDRGMSPVDALKESWRMTTGHKVSLFVMMLLGVLVVLAGELACGLGVIVGSYPIIMVANAYVYLKLKGEQPKLIGA